jgi:hypothetical protein
MWTNPLFGCVRVGLVALVGLAVLVAAAGTARWCASARLPEVEVGDLAADPEAYRGREVIVTGEWWTVGPSDVGFRVVLRDRTGVRVACHFAGVASADRAEFESRLPRLGEVAVRGRCDGVEDGMAVLRGCRLLD